MQHNSEYVLIFIWLRYLVAIPSNLVDRSVSTCFVSGIRSRFSLIIVILSIRIRQRPKKATTCMQEADERIERYIVYISG